MLHSMNNPVVFVWPRPLRLHFIAAQLFRVFWCNTWAQRRPFICLPLCSGPFYLLLVQSHPLKMSTHNAPGQVCRCCRCCGNGDNNRLIKTRMERWSEVWEGVTVQPLIPKLLFARLCDFVSVRASPSLCSFLSSSCCVFSMPPGRKIQRCSCPQLLPPVT